MKSCITNLVAGEAKDLETLIFVLFIQLLEG